MEQLAEEYPQGYHQMYHYEYPNQSQNQGIPGIFGSLLSWGKCFVGELIYSASKKLCGI